MLVTKGGLVCEIHRIAPLWSGHFSDSTWYVNWNFPWKNSGIAAPYKKSCLGWTESPVRNQAFRRGHAWGWQNTRTGDARGGQDSAVSSGPFTASHQVTCKRGELPGLQFWAQCGHRNLTHLPWVGSREGLDVPRTWDQGSTCTERRLNKEHAWFSQIHAVKSPFSQGNLSFLAWLSCIFKCQTSKVITITMDPHTLPPLPNWGS